MKLRQNGMVSWWSDWTLAARGGALMKLQFLFRSNRPLFRLAAGLTPETWHLTFLTTCCQKKAEKGLFFHTLPGKSFFKTWNIQQNRRDVRAGWRSTTGNRVCCQKRHRGFESLSLRHHPILITKPRGSRFWVQRLEPMDTAHNINQNLVYPSYPIKWNGFIARWRHDPFDTSCLCFFNPERWTLNRSTCIIAFVA